jgi:hypothetical protein
MSVSIEVSTDVEIVGTTVRDVSISSEGRVARNVWAVVSVAIEVRVATTDSMLVEASRSVEVMVSRRVCISERDSMSVEVMVCTEVCTSEEVAMVVWVIIWGTTRVDVSISTDVRISSLVRTVVIESEIVKVSRKVFVVKSDNVRVTRLVDATLGTSTVRLAVTRSENVCVIRKVDVLPDMSVATDVIVVLNIRVDVISGTSIVRTVVRDMGTVAVVKIREVLPK